VSAALLLPSDARCLAWSVAPHVMCMMLLFAVCCPQTVGCGCSYHLGPAAR